MGVIAGQRVDPDGVPPPRSGRIPDGMAAVPRRILEDGSADVKYLLLIYSNPASWERMSKDFDGVMTEVEELVGELTESGEWVGGQALADPVHTTTVRVRDGAPVVTDGPFLEAKEHLAGYCVLECESLARAVEIATRWPDARYNGVELRPIMTDRKSVV